MNYGVIGQLRICTDLFRTLLMGRIAAGLGAIPLTAKLRERGALLFPMPDLMIANAVAWCTWRRLDSVMLNPSISLKSSPQLARPDSMHSKTAAWNERTAAQSYFDARHIKVIKCDVLRDWLGGGVVPLKCQDNHTQILLWKDLWTSFEKDWKEHAGEATLGGYRIYPCISRPFKT